MPGQGMRFEMFPVERARTHSLQQRPDVAAGQGRAQIADDAITFSQLYPQPAPHALIRHQYGVRGQRPASIARAQDTEQLGQTAQIIVVIKVEHAPVSSILYVLSLNEPPRRGATLCYAMRCSPR